MCYISVLFMCSLSFPCGRFCVFIWDLLAVSFIPLSRLIPQTQPPALRIHSQFLPISPYCSAGINNSLRQRRLVLSVLLNEFGEETVRFRVTVSLPFSMLLILPPSPTSLSLSLYLSRFLSGGCHHGDSTVRMLQYEDQEGCSLSPMATASIRCEHCVAHTTSPPPTPCITVTTQSLIDLLCHLWHQSWGH